MSQTPRWQPLFDKIENLRLLQCVRGGLISIIPALMTGSAALLLSSFPWPAYQSFIASFAGGALLTLFTFAQNATFGMLAVHMTIALSVSYTREYSSDSGSLAGAVFASLGGFAIFSGVLGDSFSFSSFGVQGMFNAIFCSIAASALYVRLCAAVGDEVRLMSDGADGEFNAAMRTIGPTMLVIGAFAAVNLLISLVFNVGGFQELFINAANGIFANMGRGVGSALLFVCLSNTLWFFGVHGSDVLEGVSLHLFQPADAINAASAAAGGAGTEIFTKTFFDVFVVMGGCGAALCLLLALALFSRRHSSRRLARISALPVLFNINEPLVFGLPIVYNPIMFIPFILTPAAVMLSSFAAMSWGLVPVTTTAVHWTTPVFLSGWLATGSPVGALLQLFNLLMGAAIYTPFVRAFEREKRLTAQRTVSRLVERLKLSEESLEPVALLELPGLMGATARGLAEDIKYFVANERPTMHYQPLCDRDGRCFGAEALLRYEHPIYGALYPPLVVKLAGEAGALPALERGVFERVAQDYDTVSACLGEGITICVNVSAASMRSDDFEEFLQALARDGVTAKRLCIEITEQMTLLLDDFTESRLARIREMGYKLAIDDFSMGSTSLKYLRSNKFDLVKLDGSLVCDVNTNPRSREIIATIVRLATSLGFEVLAEFVETEEQRSALERIGCMRYQGWLFGKARSPEQLQNDAAASGR